MDQPSSATPKDAIRTMRILGAALGTGVTVFAATVWLLHRNAPPEPAGPALLYIWIAVATTLVAGSMIVWRGRVVPVVEQPHPGGSWRPLAAAIQTGLLITLALVEAAALFGVVVYLLQGHALAGGLGVTMIWAAVILTWPQEEWLATAGAVRE
jgi:hypothetical protein